MTKSIAIEPKDVPQHLRGGYSGRKFKAQAAETMTIGAHAGLWDGGSKDYFYAIRLEDGARVEISDSFHAPWDSERRSQTVTLKPGFAVVEHSIFCGKDMGLRFYLHPADIAKMLPAPVELNAYEKHVLNATACYKASYNGQDRYDMSLRDWPREQTESDNPMSRPLWEIAKQALIERKLLNKAGAITVAGRNAVA
tara:strand:- start:322 stop:909 length:588 start_codon:yes stop_codon:yes gene_type:complete